MKLSLTLTLVSTVNALVLCPTLLAHPGHGATDSNGLLHHVTTAPHLTWITLVVLGVASVGVLNVGRRSKRVRLHK